VHNSYKYLTSLEMYVIDANMIHRQIIDRIKAKKRRKFKNLAPGIEVFPHT